MTCLSGRTQVRLLTMMMMMMALQRPLALPLHPVHQAAAQ
jgi:hypothetical protein